MSTPCGVKVNEAGVFTIAVLSHPDRTKEHRNVSRGKQSWHNFSPPVLLLMAPGEQINQARHPVSKHIRYPPGSVSTGRCDT